MFIGFLLKYRKQFCIRSHELFLNYSKPFLYFVSLSYTLYICIRNPVLLFLITSFTSRLTHRHLSSYFCTVRSIFPIAERLRVQIETCWRTVFFSLQILLNKSRLGVGCGNSWRCSNMCDGLFRWSCNLYCCHNTSVCYMTFDCP